ncbi:cytochrome oxidase subunit III [Lutibacter sp. HS1-25]|uniref:cytochrome c oxidase subunit 3 n=1 Tax=Lutibacter sp. HS1-25 TaxID=2485000 RepID=UPI0010113EDA|nr:cytochrome c oxidase subunit 3 [Lutibacter sp. HS1-25]RXP64595.1 cytochrome oxidase subunit III [Lutibacter sp. HS1-25]
MEANIATKTNAQTWGGGDNNPLGASYGKMMMWFFILSDALTFSGFLGAYGFMRFKFNDSWPIAEEVFTHFPFLHGVPAPMYYVAFMTFVLIFSSVTMVLAVDAGKALDKKKVTFYMLLTIIGGIIFIGSQAWEWKNFINGTYGAVELNDGKIIQFVNKDGKQVALESFAKANHSERTQLTRDKGMWFMSESAIPPFTVNDVIEGFEAHPELSIRTEKVNLETKEKTIVPRDQAMSYLKEARTVVMGANLQVNEYGMPLFADFFFFITGFHGFHVLSGIVLNIIIFFNVIIGTYDRRGSYEMVEKVGLYWHFVDLVWVFVFTFFYLV